MSHGSSAIFGTIPCGIVIIINFQNIHAKYFCVDERMGEKNQESAHILILIILDHGSIIEPINMIYFENHKHTNLYNVHHVLPPPCNSSSHYIMQVVIILMRQISSYKCSQLKFRVRFFSTTSYSRIYNLIRVLMYNASLNMINSQQESKRY